MRTAILVFDDVEVLDACGPFEVLSVAAREVVRTEAGLGADDPGPRETVLVSRDGGTVRARGGLVLTADHALDDVPAVDLVVVPGGVTADVERDERVLAWVAGRAAAGALVASVCTGAFVLAEAGVLTHGQATTHGDDLAELARRYPDLDVVGGQGRDPWPDAAGGQGGDGGEGGAGVRWVRNGPRLWTSAGISAGLDLTLALVAETGGLPLARATARRMEYAWESRAHRRD